MQDLRVEVAVHRHGMRDVQQYVLVSESVVGMYEHQHYRYLGGCWIAIFDQSLLAFSVLWRLDWMFLN